MNQRLAKVLAQFASVPRAAVRSCLWTTCDEAFEQAAHRARLEAWDTQFYRVP